MEEKILLQHILKELKKVNENLGKLNKNMIPREAKNVDELLNKSRSEDGHYSWESKMSLVNMPSPYTKDKK